MKQLTEREEEVMNFFLGKQGTLGSGCRCPSQ